ncbi:DNA polymerase III subunit chi [Thorsellia anophelis]|uniref:DNA polymerase III, chi subunit n=1 Tax=Thorsellia anophelis DSM 18579 TaxID=1123402 RepID=A0A1H9ZHX6_9GAMM|nr:DNA polymerase III subunit chi [Thorsellia anophelis]SES80926.1 DNA polymerase III, chi subunit [Thorsellia anophelis DSM 18579]
MKQAFFYLLNELSPSFDESELVFEQTQTLNLTQRDRLGCWLAARYYQTNKRVLLVCENQKHAERLDEWLWQLDPDRFIAHNLAGEGPKIGAPIELCWPERRSNIQRDIMIHLATPFVDFAPIFKSIIDFVPAIEQEKIAARERYKQYREIGYQLKTGTVPETFLNEQK